MYSNAQAAGAVITCFVTSISSGSTACFQGQFGRTTTTTMNGEIRVDYDKPLGGSRRSKVFQGTADQGRLVAVKTLAPDASLDVSLLLCPNTMQQFLIPIRPYWNVLNAGRTFDTSMSSQSMACPHKAPTHHTSSHSTTNMGIYASTCLQATILIVQPLCVFCYLQMQSEV